MAADRYGLEGLFQRRRICCTGPDRSPTGEDEGPWRARNSLRYLCSCIIATGKDLRASPRGSQGRLERLASKVRDPWLCYVETFSARLLASGNLRQALLPPLL